MGANFPFKEEGKERGRKEGLITPLFIFGDWVELHRLKRRWSFIFPIWVWATNFLPLPSGGAQNLPLSPSDGERVGVRGFSDPELNCSAPEKGSFPDKPLSPVLTDGHEPKREEKNSGRLLSGHGLINLELRLASIGGTCTLQSAPGKGTRVELNVHLNGDASPVMVTGGNGAKGAE